MYHHQNTRLSSKKNNKIMTTLIIKIVIKESSSYTIQVHYHRDREEYIAKQSRINQKDEKPAEI